MRCKLFGLAFAGVLSFIAVPPSPSHGTSFGTAQDVTLQELRIECFFPMDAETEQNAKALTG